MSVTKEQIRAELKRREKARIRAELDRRQSVREEPSLADKAIGVAEATTSLATGVPASIAAGITGIGQTLNPFAEEGAGDRAVKQVQEAFTFQPRTERGQQIVREIPEFLSPLTNLIDKARTGDATLARTNSPLLATINELGPEIVGAMVGLRGLQQPGPKTVKVDKNQQLVPDIKGRAAIADKLRNNPNSAEVARFKLVNGRAVKDAAANAALGQGWTDKTVAGIKAASDSTKSQVRKMIDVARGRGEKGTFRNEVLTRPSDVLGNSLHNRYKFLEGANKSAGRQLDSIAKGMSDLPVDVRPAFQNFTNWLNEQGVRIINGKANFELSRLPKGDQSAIQNALKQIRVTKGDNFASAHKLKQDLRRGLKFEKGKALAKGPLSSDTEIALKTISRDIDQVLDGWSKPYDNANVKFGETAEVLNSIRDVVKKRLQTESADKSMGVLLRRMTGNAESRAPIMDMVDNIENVTKKYGGSFQDDLILQQKLVNEMDDVLGTAADTSIRGELGAQAATALERSSMGHLAHGLDRAAQIIGRKSEDKALGTLWRLAR